MLPRSLLALTLLPALAHAEDPALAKIRREIQAAMKRSAVQGMSLAIVKDGKVVFAEGFGLADVARRKKATPDTVYEIGSSTKAFTALLAAQAAQEGRLSLSDRPAKYLPAFRLKDKDADARITIEDMLSHRSGLPRIDLAWYAGTGFSRDDLLQVAAQAEPTAPLGKAWQYQNLMYVFAGMIEEKVYGKPFDALLQDRFFGPLGMAHSASTYAATKREADLATGYPSRGAASGSLPLPLKEIDRAAPAGSVSSSVRDMAKYVTMLLADGEFEGRRLFAKEAVEETRKPRIAMAPGQSYGLGWMLGEFRGEKTVFHGGNIDGFTAMVSLMPGKGIGVVALSNGDGAALPQQAATLVYEALGPKEPATDAPAEKMEEAKESELGAYKMAAPPVEVDFSREGKTTTMTQNGAKLPLTLIGPKRYTYEKLLTITFGGVDKDGKKTVSVEQGAARYTMTAVEPYRSPIDAATLLAKAVEAQGGADAIRRHDRMVVRYRTRMPSQAIEIYGIRYRRDAASAADFSRLYALGRPFAESRSATDGVAEFDVASFSAPTVKTGPEAADALLAASIEADLDPKRRYKALEVVREDKVGAEPVFVLQKTAPSGAKTLEFVSKKDYRILARESGSGASRRREAFSDFRNVDGLILPFRTETTTATGEKSTEEILGVRFDERVPEWPFRRP